MRVRIGVDAMGGDNAPGSVVKGVADVLRASTESPEIVLVGDGDVVLRELRAQSIDEGTVSVVHAADTIGMGEEPMEALRRHRRDSSISVLARLLKSGDIDGMISGGNTGAMVASALVEVGRLRGVDRPAIAMYIPTEKQLAVVLDVGANSNCKPVHLLQFAHMGAVYSRWLIGCDTPRVGLLSIGEEPSKGTDTTVAAHELIRDSRLNFIGNVEGRDILTGKADVVVCDGFVGNVVLKFAESIATFFSNLIRRETRSNLVNRFGATLLRPVLGRLKAKMDYAEYGGAPLLGIAGVCVISHGVASPRAVRGAVGMAKGFVEAGFQQELEECMASLTTQQVDGGAAQC
jgi:glycerol-3-phosphate acyltransferase PlsX